MKNINGFWLPSEDTYFVNKPNYESELTRRSLENVKSFRTAIDVGAHCGYWTQRLSKNFNKVVSFEPIEEHFGCLEKNTQNCKNVRLIKAAASNEAKVLNMEQTLTNSGQSKICENGIRVESITIDSLELEDVDFMKIDVEGHEKNVIIGASNTIEKYKPVMFVEINEKYEEMEKLLKSMGYYMKMDMKFNYLWEYRDR